MGRACVSLVSERAETTSTGSPVSAARSIARLSSLRADAVAEPESAAAASVAGEVSGVSPSVPPASTATSAALLHRPAGGRLRDVSGMGDSPRSRCRADSPRSPPRSLAVGRSAEEYT
ncbi:hypothetical protein GCM10010451_65360 [Streptomyces virens]|uniref:Uncharacterized protein n=1 Tax=Streptomyces virens TaxID=285572 RepID=A0ABP6Q5L2_9ACTN|nr:hypothetical protein GCM10010247_45440 [Streptomyces calvus]